MIFFEEFYNNLIMNKLEKLAMIKDLCVKHKITAYEIGKNTKISQFAAHKILTGETKNPNEATVDIILDFIEDQILGVKPIEKESDEFQKLRRIEDIIADKVVQRLQPLLLNLERGIVQSLLDIEKLGEKSKKKLN